MSLFLLVSPIQLLPRLPNSFNNTQYFPAYSYNGTVAVTSPTSGFNNDTVVTDTHNNTVTQGPFDKAASSMSLPTNEFPFNHTNATATTGLLYNSTIGIIPAPTSFTITLSKGHTMTLEQLFLSYSIYQWYLSSYQRDIPQHYYCDSNPISQCYWPCPYSKWHS